ncbi:hypothetical protein BKA70DRAFT_1324204, partial [Coprinopsis sp. MPI-PUGE-AT-0042]
MFTTIPSVPCVHLGLFVQLLFVAMLRLARPIPIPVAKVVIVLPAWLVQVVTPRGIQREVAVSWTWSVVGPRIKPWRKRRNVRTKMRRKRMVWERTRWIR